MVRHCLTDTAEVDFANEEKTEAVLEMCAVFENLHHKLLRMDIKCSAVRQGEGDRQNTYLFNHAVLKAVEGAGEADKTIGGRSWTYQ